MEINLIPHNLDKMHFKAGLYQNCFNCDLILLVAYLSQKQIQEAVDLVKTLNVGIKTYPHITEIIEKIEEMSGDQLLG